MTKNCIYCPNDFHVPNNGQTLSPYGVCPQCRQALDRAQDQGPAALAVLELAALVGDAGARSRDGAA